jgi:hypothetical protein
MNDPMQSTGKEKGQIFSGNIYIFHALDVGYEIEIDKVKAANELATRPLSLPKYFKNYHTPLAVELPNRPETSTCVSCKIHNFGPIALSYKIPFKDTLENVRLMLQDTVARFQEESIIDARSVFNKIERFTARPHFFQTRSSYVVIQVDQGTDPKNIDDFKKNYGGIIASMLRFETETLSEYQKNEILQDALGYFRKDMIVVDTEATFIYDDDYTELLDLIEFCNIQNLELRYFDRLLDTQLNTIYEEKMERVSPVHYLPFIHPPWAGPTRDLGKLRVEISVISERLDNSIKLAGEAYFSELYDLMVIKLGLKNWHTSINKKLEIIGDIRAVYQNKIDTIREDMLSLLVILLIFIEVIIGLLK